MLNTSRKSSELKNVLNPDVKPPSMVSLIFALLASLLSPSDKSLFLVSTEVKSATLALETGNISKNLMPY